MMIEEAQTNDNKIVIIKNNWLSRFR